MKMKAKAFDCVEMMHKAALRIYEETKGMTVEQELAYWRSRREDARSKDAAVARERAEDNGAK